MQRLIDHKRQMATSHRHRFSVRKWQPRWRNTLLAGGCICLYVQRAVVLQYSTALHTDACTKVLIIVIYHIVVLYKYVEVASHNGESHLQQAGAVHCRSH
jgi:hypothetical protein